MLNERDYIQLCKKQIEKHIGINNESSTFISRDLAYLARIIKEKSDITISHSTLKRLWNDKYSTVPQPATLNALANVLDYDDWQSFKQQNAFEPESKRGNSKYLKVAVLGLILISIFSLGAFIVNKNYSSSLPVDEVYFTANKTISVGLPNTVIFKYNLSGLDADSFFIQQSCTETRKDPIDPKDSIMAEIYHTPGYHTANLIANDKIVATKTIHILSDGWMPYITNVDQCSEVIYFEFADNCQQGYFKLDEAKLEENGIDINTDFTLTLHNSFDFGVTDKGFTLNTIFKCDSIKPNVYSSFDIMLVFESKIFGVKLVKKGCEYYAGYKIGETYTKGSNADLSALGCNVYEWQNLEFIIRNKLAEVVLNGDLIISEEYNNNAGKLMGIIYQFNGLGAVDFLEVRGDDDEVIYVDDFN